MAHLPHRLRGMVDGLAGHLSSVLKLRGNVIVADFKALSEGQTPSMALDDDRRLVG